VEFSTNPVDQWIHEYSVWGLNSLPVVWLSLIAMLESKAKEIILKIIASTVK